MFIKSRRTLIPGYYERQANASRLEWARQHQSDGISIQLPHCPEPCLGDLQAPTEGLHGPGDAVKATVPAFRLAGPGDGADGPRQHTPHGPLSTQARPSWEPLRALRPCRRHSRGKQCQELPVVLIAHQRSLWSGHVLRASAIGLAACALDRVSACPRGYNGRSRPEGAIWRLDLRSQATAQMERQLLSALRHKHGGSDIIMMAKTITPFAGARY